MKIGGEVKINIFPVLGSSLFVSVFFAYVR